MNADADEQTQLLRGIWTEMKTLGDNLGRRIDTTNAELRGLRTEMNDRFQEVDNRFQALDRRQVQTETRIATEIVAVSGAVDRVAGLLREHLKDRHRLDSLEDRVSVLERQTG